MILTRRSRLSELRKQRGWSQAALAERTGVSRAEVSALETGRIVPSVLVALRLAEALETPVERLYAKDRDTASEPPWAWLPSGGETRVWRASVNGALRLYPLEATAAGVVPHDGMQTGQGLEVVDPQARPDRTLVMAGCDPLVGALVHSLAAQHGVRLLPLLRSSSEALDLLARGLVHVAGLHLTDGRGGSTNARAVSSRLGGGYRLIHQLRWRAGIALAAGRRERNTRALLSANVRWVNREEGSAARQTFDRIVGRGRRPQGYARVVRGHRAVAATVSSGWA